MSDQSLGNWLRRERERRGVTLRAISDETKVALPLLQGLEDDDVSRWPGGIFRRSFVRAYATTVGLDPEDVVRRFEQEHGTGEPVPPGAAAPSSDNQPGAPALAIVPPAARSRYRTSLSVRARAIGTAADLAVALVLGLGSAAAGSRLLWPVLLIAAYYAAGVVLTGTSPMVALLRDEVAPAQTPATAPATDSRAASAERPATVRRPLRVVRSTRAARQRAR